MTRAARHSLVVGLTGGIASGKSTVDQILIAAGLPVVDADQVARQVVEPGTVGLSQVVSHFGKDVLLPTGELNRRELGRRVFKDAAQRKALNKLLQPLIKAEIKSQVRSLIEAGHAVVVMDVPLLFEAGYVDDCDRVVVVNVKPDIQVQRLMARNGYSREEALERIKAQMPLAEKAARADYVIDNNGDQKALKTAVEAFLATLPRR